jgi:threonine synthase
VKYASTRDPARAVTLSQALVEGLAPDGGLYVPQAMPAPGAHWPAGRTPLGDLAPPLLAPFFAGDALARALAAISAEAFDFPAPLSAWQGQPERLSLLELFHGPTAAFKDFGAQFLAACLARLQEPGGPQRTVLVATSGDTGGAVAAAFQGRSGFRVVLLYPDGRVSPAQEHQLCCWGGNVQSLAVQGSFDDCQRLVKQAFAQPSLRARHGLTSANSINVGRLLPQLVLFAAAALEIRDAGGAPANFVIPSGNLGLATACCWAREIGLPVGDIVLAHNANRTVPDFLADGRWRPRASVATLASAMDVGDPSNMERLMALYPGPGAIAARLRAMSIDDATIRASIGAEFARTGFALCPHSAAGLAAYRRLPESDRRRGHWVVAATAHAAKFPEIVEPLVGRRVEPPPPLAALLGRPIRKQRIGAGLAELEAALGEAACTP